MKSAATVWRCPCGRMTLTLAFPPLLRSPCCGQLYQFVYRKEVKP